MNPQIVNTICEYFKSKPVDKAWVFMGHRTKRIEERTREK